MKRHYKLFIGILIGIIIFVTGTVVAETIIESKNVTYSNTNSGGSYADVQEAIDELYARAKYVGELYQEEILNGAYPVLGDGMIPIYLSDNGDAYYADLYTKWYSYKEKKWANAVMLTDTGKTKEYKTGDKINENDIRAYFVWIPRYAYKLWNLGSYTTVPDGNTLKDTSYADSTSQASNNARIIEVEFGTKSYLDSKSYKSLTRNPNTGAFSDPTGIATDNYLQHPGFTLGEKELNGIWVGKFENSKNNSGIFIKPNETSWRGVNLSTMFNMALEFNATLTSHMMKNTEWGAVAYLSYSAYGKGSKININNTKDYKTGYSAGTDQNSNLGTAVSSSELDKTQPWNTATGYLASTTGNITGVYDMAGGAWEYVAATIINNGQKIAGDASGFEPSDITTYMKSGYIDAYPADSNTTSYNKRILGDATGELGPFYKYKIPKGYSTRHNSWSGSNYADFINPNSAGWFLRGDNSVGGVMTDQFSFLARDGLENSDRGSRLVLTSTARVS